MKRKPYSDQASRLWFLLAQTRRAVKKLRRIELAKSNISNSEAGVLIFVDASEPGEATPTNISRFFLKEPHGISQLLDRMESKGLILKKKDLIPKNRVRIEITEKGRVVLKELKAHKIVKEVFNSLSSKQKKDLEDILGFLVCTAIEKLNFENRNTQKWNAIL